MASRCRRGFLQLPRCTLSPCYEPVSGPSVYARPDLVKPGFLAQFLHPIYSLYRYESSADNAALLSDPSIITNSCTDTTACLESHAFIVLSAIEG